MMVALSVLVTDTSAQAQETDGASRRVVILNGTDPYLPAFLALDSALREAIRMESRVPVDFYAETLDMYRFPQKLFDHDVAALLRKKYHGLKIDVVVADATIALDFARRYRAEIWPDAVIVFNSMPTSSLRERSLDPHTIGVPVQLEFGPTLDLALQLRPATQKVAIVAGTADPDRKHLLLAQAALEQAAGRFDIQYLVGLTLAETVTAVQGLLADTVVLYTTMFRDGADAPQVPRDALKRIVAVSRVPVFGVFETYLGDGIVAGSITSYGTQGRRTGELVARVLNGEDPSAIGVQAPVAPHCIADWRQLRHWDIDERRLPADCEVRFKEVTLWDRYYRQVLAVLAVVLMQTVLIIVLMLNYRRLQRAQVALADEYGRRIQAESFATLLCARLARFSKERSLGAMATSISHEINQPLIAIKNYTQAAKQRLQSHFDHKPKVIELLGKIEAQAERAGAITQRIRSLVNASDVQLLPISPGLLIEEVIRVMESEIERRGCDIAYESAGDLPAVFADALQVQLVLVNLLQNAMQSVCSSDQYDKHIFIDLDPLNDQEAQISVADRGPGVPPNQAADLFEPFYSSTSGGMGMGLAISQAIIDAHGGRLWYEPNLTGGAIFRFTLRIADS
ncbi:MAG TPA: ATP-binding protein [Candidatus Competibacteraceae bacterium]|nr:ATP-binding protein [Candidatus Competibacteraceae bacterium]